MNWTNETNRNVRVRGKVIEPGDSVDIDEPTAAEELMFGEKDDDEVTAPRRSAARGSKRRGKVLARATADDSTNEE